MMASLNTKERGGRCGVVDVEGGASRDDFGAAAHKVTLQSEESQSSHDKIRHN
jgi:hypothetical protein